MPTHLILSPPSFALVILYEKTVEKLLSRGEAFQPFFVLQNLSPSFDLYSIFKLLIF